MQYQSFMTRFLSYKILISIIILFFLSLPLIFFYGVNITPYSEGLFYRTIDFFINDNLTKDILINGQGAANHLTTFLGYLIKVLLSLFGIDFKVPHFIFLSLFFYYLFFITLTIILIKNSKLYLAIFITGGLISSGIAPYMFIYGGLIDGMSLFLITLSLIFLTLEKWNKYIALSLIGMFTHQIIVLVSLTFLLIKFLNEYKGYKFHADSFAVPKEEKRMTRKERNILNLEKKRIKKFDFSPYLKSSIIIFSSLITFQIFNLIFLKDFGGAFLYNTINIKDSIIVGIGHTPLNLITTLQFLWIPTILFIFIQLKKDYFSGIFLTIPIIFSLISLFFWSDITRILYHFSVPVFLIIIGSVLKIKSLDLLRININPKHTKLIIYAVLISSALNFFTPSFIIQDNDLISFSRLSIIDLDENGNGAATYSFISEGNTNSSAEGSPVLNITPASTSEVDKAGAFFNVKKWGLKRGLQNWSVNKKDYALTICTPKNDSVIFGGRLGGNKMNTYKKTFFDTKCMMYLRTFNFLQLKWRLWAEL